MNTACIWNAKGICGFDISQPGRQVLCSGPGCKDFDPRPTAEEIQQLDRELNAQLNELLHLNEE